jgi:hypothetical protein
MTTWLLSVLHNCIVHPLLPFLPQAIGDRLHEVTGEWWSRPR